MRCPFLNLVCIIESKWFILTAECLENKETFDCRKSSLPFLQAHDQSETGWFLVWFDLFCSTGHSGSEWDDHEWQEADCPESERGGQDKYEQRKLLKATAGSINFETCMHAVQCCHSWTSLFRTRLIRNPRYFEVKLNPVRLIVTWCQLGYFETLLFRTIFHVPWDFEIARFDCISFYFGAACGAKIMTLFSLAFYL